MDNSDKNFDVATNKENPETRLIENQSYEKFWDEINDKLSEKELQILNEYLEGYSYEQIAQKLQIDRKSVDNALVRIRAKLSHLLK
ncbi:MAG: helix-turn-helix domain-containing protein [Clostridia bacterium]|nr:helix-turn-helix domain-containing protein [Clostridia bacterium]